MFFWTCFGFKSLFGFGPVLIDPFVTLLYLLGIGVIASAFALCSWTLHWDYMLYCRRLRVMSLNGAKPDTAVTRCCFQIVLRCTAAGSNFGADLPAASPVGARPADADRKGVGGLLQQGCVVCFDDYLLQNHSQPKLQCFSSNIFSENFLILLFSPLKLFLVEKSSPLFSHKNVVS